MKSEAMEIKKQSEPSHQEQIIRENYQKANKILDNLLKENQTRRVAPSPNSIELRGKNVQTG